MLEDTHISVSAEMLGIVARSSSQGKHPEAKRAVMNASLFRLRLKMNALLSFIIEVGGLTGRSPQHRHLHGVAKGGRARTENGAKE
jgi:hypothetical protein